MNDAIIALHRNEVIGILRPMVDAHTLGSSYITHLLHDCGYRVVVGDRLISEAVNEITKSEKMDYVRQWILKNEVTRIGYSFRLNPKEAQALFRRFYWQIQDKQLLTKNGGPIRAVYFAGLPEACQRIRAEYQGEIVVFDGDETSLESLEKIGVPRSQIPKTVQENSDYDDMRTVFARDLIAKEAYRRIDAVDRSGYAEYGTRDDHIMKRLLHGMQRDLPPLIRAHVGPYLPRREDAIALFHDWIRRLRENRLLDILSIGTSQLTQSHFGTLWGDQPNGGGVPVANEAEYSEILERSRPMLVRTYAGTRNVPALARIHERSLNTAWHALSFWWFCQIDGRGPNSVRENLSQHVKTLDYIAKTGKPFEPNIPHHFSFRGADDVTCVLSVYLAARTAKRHGVRFLILQVMLNTPKYTSGLQDLAKARAMLRLVRELEDDSFRVILQPRAGLDHFVADLEKARVQLASVTALMDDIEPNDPLSPPIIHVVSYSEASHLADPPVIHESIQIVRSALQHYRYLRTTERVPNLATSPGVVERADELYEEVRVLLRTIHRVIPDPLSANGLYRIFTAGFLPVPYLWECREEFPAAVQWQTAVINGGVKVVDEDGTPINAATRAEEALMKLREMEE
ncbi:MAG: cobalamin-binding protein [Gammaproteobacteria bacterium]|nr:cobalamin-binding protein [Gammaproteobacteria bacterium]